MNSKNSIYTMKKGIINESNGNTNLTWKANFVHLTIPFNEFKIIQHNSFHQRNYHRDSIDIDPISSDFSLIKRISFNLPINSLKDNFFWIDDDNEILEKNELGDIVHIDIRAGTPHVSTQEQLIEQEKNQDQYVTEDSKLYPTGSVNSSAFIMDSELYFSLGIDKKFFDSLCNELLTQQFESKTLTILLKAYQEQTEAAFSDPAFSNDYFVLSRSSCYFSELVTTKAISHTNESNEHWDSSLFETIQSKLPTNNKTINNDNSWLRVPMWGIFLSLIAIAIKLT